MKRILLFSGIVAILGITILSATGNGVTGVYVYPSNEYSPKCIDFCKENGVKTIFMQPRSVKKGYAAPYHEAGHKVFCGWVPYKRIWDFDQKKTDQALKTWIKDDFGKDDLKDISGFAIDEPFIDYGDWEKETLSDIDKDTTQKNLYLEKFKTPIFSHRSMGNPSEWRNILSFRQIMFWNKLKNLAANLQNNYPENTVLVNLTPATYESGSTTGVDINLLNSYLPETVKLSIDPYFQAFRRPLQWSGMMIRWFRNANNNRKIGGIIQYYDAIKDSGWPSEGYMPLEPDDIPRQVFEYLMHGATDISAFVMASRIFTGKPEYESLLGKSLKFVKGSESFWKETKPLSQAAIYFSENTFRMYDMWGPWSRMTGLYGTSFQVEWTYYALSYMHIPADIISVAFNNEQGLLEKLEKYKVVILPDVKCVSPYEAECFKKYVSAGGNLIVSGETSFYNENGQFLEKMLLAELTGIKHIEKAQPHQITSLENSLVPGMEGKIISSSGNASTLFKQQATRHPQWLKDKCVEMKYDGYDIKFAQKTPKPSSLKIIPKTAKVIAVYPDMTAAVTANQFGKGKCVYIAPADLTLFKGVVTDSLEDMDETAKTGLEFFNALLTTSIGKRTFETSGLDGVEVAYRESEAKNEHFLYFLNHNIEVTKNAVVKLNLKAEMVSEIVMLEQLSKKEEKIKINSEKPNDFITINLPPFKYGIMIKIILR